MIQTLTLAEIFDRFYQTNWNLGHDLDKDLLGDGTEYNPENCTFLPKDVNIFLAENWSKDKHDLPIGVQYIQPATKGSKEGYVARCHTDKGREYLGYFNDPMSAYFAYKIKKRNMQGFQLQNSKTRLRKNLIIN